MTYNLFKSVFWKDWEKRGRGGHEKRERDRLREEMALSVPATPFTYVVHVLGLAGLVLVLVWTIHFRGGLAWDNTNKNLIFNVSLLLFFKNNFWVFFFCIFYHDLWHIFKLILLNCMCWISSRVFDQVYISWQTRLVLLSAFWVCVIGTYRFHRLGISDEN